MVPRGPTSLYVCPLSPSSSEQLENLSEEEVRFELGLRGQLALEQGAKRGLTLTEEEAA